MPMFLKQKRNKKTAWDILYFSYIKHKPLQNMLSYFLKCQNNTENVDQKLLKTKNVRTILSSKCAVWGKERS